MNWFDLKSHYSIKQAYGSPEKLVESVKGCSYAALTDINSISGCISFTQECKKVGIKPILGCTFSTKEGRITCLARNLSGWKALIKLVSLSYTKEFYDSVNEKPYLTIEKICEFGRDLIAILGFPGDILSYKLFDKTIFHEVRDVILEHLVRDPLEVIKELSSLKSFFSAMFFGLSPNGTDYTNWMNEVVRDSGAPTIILSNSFYPTSLDYTYLEILICSRLKSTKTKWLRNAEIQEPELLRFKENKWAIPTEAEITEKFTAKEIEDSNNISRLFEDFQVLSSPRLPQFKTPNGQTPHQYLTELCRLGWKKKLIDGGRVSTEESKLKYLERIKMELESIGEAGLSSYFLIVSDFIKFVYDNGWRTSPGRGSVGGCLIAYLTNITTIDPIEYNLSYQRFWNNSRKGSMPDIDVDVPPESRETVIQYIRNKYNSDRVGHLATYGEMKGATAIKEVLRINDACSFEQMNEITKQIPELGKVADEMENTGEDSLLLFTLKYRPDKLKDWARWEENSVVGDYAEWFRQAIKMEGTIQSIGKHASAIVVFEEALSNVCPMINDKSGDEPMVGYSMGSAEKCGLIKLDLLGLANLSKILEVNNILRERKDYYRSVKV